MHNNKIEATGYNLGWFASQPCCPCASFRSLGGEKMKQIILTLWLLFIPVISLASGSVPSMPTPQINTIDESKPPLSLSQQAKWAQLVGRWFGSEITKNGGKVMWIAERLNDGKYKIHFRIIDASGKQRDKIEVGEWGISGPVYFTIYKGDVDGDKVVPVDPTDPFNRDAYKILRLTNDIFEYESFDSANKYTVRKVSPEFKFPE